MITAFRLFHAEKIMTPSSQGSPGMDEVRWKVPVRPGDTIHVEAEVEAARVSASRPHLGVVNWLYVVKNQRDEVVMSWKSAVMTLRRPENRPPETVEV